MLAMIVAKAANNVIGKDNQLIWHISKDLRHFKRLTTGHVIIMGRKTLESLPRLLPNREHWVVTRQADYVPPFEGVRVFHSPEEAAVVANSIDDTVYCIGGAEMYKAFMPYADHLYVTEIFQDFEGDAVFPNIEEQDFVETARMTGHDETDEYKFDFVEYSRRSK